MARKIVWDEQALEDLLQAADYISRDSQHYAQALIDKAAAAARSLLVFPESGRRVPEIHDANIRELFVQSYRLIYEVQPEALDVIAFVHGARNLSLWRKKEGSSRHPEEDTER